MAQREDADLETVGLLDVGGVVSCLGEPSVSVSRFLRGKVAYLSEVDRVTVFSGFGVSRGPLVGHLFSSHGELGVRHRADEVLVGFARNAGLSLTRFGRSPLGLIRGLGVSGRGFSGKVGFSLLLARSLVAKFGPRGAVAGRGVDEPIGELRFGSGTFTFTRRRGRGGAPANEELSEPQPEPHDTTLEAHDLDPPPLLSARPQPSTPLSLPAAPSASSSPAGKLSRSPSDLASSFVSHASCSPNDCLKIVKGSCSTVSTTTPLSSLFGSVSSLISLSSSLIELIFSGFTEISVSVFDSSSCCCCCSEISLF